jgi:hypothetical protein
MTQTTEASTVEVTVPAGTLRRNLSAVLPHASRDDTDLPALSAVRIEITDGFLYLSATDRYSMAVTRMPLAAAGHQDGQALLPLEHARHLRRWLRERREPRVISVAVGDGSVSVADQDGQSCKWTALEDRAGLPDLRAMAARMAAAPDRALSPGWALQPRFVARLAKTARHADAVSLRITAGRSARGETSPVVIAAAGDWLLAVFKPARSVSKGGLAGAGAAWESRAPAAARPDVTGGES